MTQRRKSTAGLEVIQRMTSTAGLEMTQWSKRNDIAEYNLGKIVAIKKETIYQPYCMSDWDIHTVYIHNISM